MEHSFGVKFGYLRWRRFLQTGKAPSFAEIAKAIGRTGPAVSAWGKATTAPTDYRIQAPLAEYFGALEATWLIKDEGTAPDPELWAIWLRYRRAQPKAVPTGALRQLTRADVDAGKSSRKTGGRR